MAKKPGKYAAVIGRLPAMGIDPSRRDAVTQAQEQIKAAEKIDGPTQEDTLYRIRGAVDYLIALKKSQTAGRPYAAEYARAYAECRAIRDKIAEWDGAFSLLVEAYQWLMISQMEVEGTTSLTLANGQPIHTFQEPYAKVEDPEKFLAWVMEDPDLRRKLTLQWQTTNKLTKDRLAAGEPEPPGVTCWAKTTVRLGSE